MDVFNGCIILPTTYGNCQVGLKQCIYPKYLLYDDVMVIAE